MEQKVLRYIREQNMLQEQDRVLVGISGGADSVCLLFLLNRLKALLGITICAVHVNHSLRGKEADKDEAYAEAFCDRLKIPFEAVRVNMKQRAQEEKLSLEEAGRVLRYEVFAQIAEKWNCNKIAVAHHGDDCAETVLFHLFRGSGLKGVAGIAPIRQQIIRPLLCIERYEIEQYLRENQVAFRTDSTNLCNDYVRNKIRNQLLPYITSEINEEAVLHILQFAETARKADEYFEGKASEIMQKYTKRINDSLWLALSVFDEEKIIVEYVLRGCILKMTASLKDVSKRHIEDIYELYKKSVGKYMTLPAGLHVKRGQDSILFFLVSEKQRDGVENDCDEAGRNVYSDCKSDGIVEIKKADFEQEDSIISIQKMGYKVQFRRFVHKKNKNIPKKTYTKWFDYDTISDVFCLRTRLTGDYFIIDEVGNRKKLQRYFIDEKVPKEERDQVLLLAAADEIIWAVGHRISENYKVTEETRIVLEVQITEDK